MLRALFILTLLFASPFVHAADGSLQMGLFLRSNDWRMDLESSENRITGSLYNAGSPFVDLKLTQDGWQGRFGELVVSRTEVENKGNGKYEVRIVTLPAGFFDYTFRVKSNGEVEISGMGPQGQLNTAGLKKNARELYVQSSGFSLGLKADESGTYEGSASLSANGTFDSGTASLRAVGRLAPSVLVQDPVLYTLIYVLPFSR